MKYNSLPIADLQTWARFNGVSFNNVAVADHITSKDGVDKGAGLLATAGFSERGALQEILLTVPADLVLSEEAVRLCAKADLHLKEIFNAVGKFAEVGVPSFLVVKPDAIIFSASLPSGNALKLNQESVWLTWSY
jgi:hypothetical protein